MSNIIKLLPDSVANQIAAGEVIQRPASAVKELLENSIDSGATKISLVIKESGKILIQVTDNGTGMSDIDIRMAFERHATSKITCADDLFSIRTMGFRGEALASIAAISQVEVKSRLQGNEIGNAISIEGSKVINQEQAQCPEGTTIMLKNLFFNVPARRNFLKSNNVELRHINEEFIRVALINPEVNFSYYSNDKLIYKLIPGSFKSRIAALFGNNYNERLLPVEQKTDLIGISGFIGKPEFAKKTRGEQYFFVNGRFIKHAYLNHAVANAYTELIPTESHPSYFIQIEIDTKDIDVNIHPTKTEVNFQDARYVYAVLHAAVKQAIGKHSLTPTIDFDVNPEVEAALSTRPSNDLKQPHIKVNPEFNPFENTKPSVGAGFNINQPDKKSIENWEQLYDYKDTDNQEYNIQSQKIPDDIFPQSMAPRLIQISGKFIVGSFKGGMIIIDQHLAHYRIIYEDFLQRLKSSVQHSQQQLFPQNLLLSPNDSEIIRSLENELKKIGFIIEDAGNNNFVIVGIPADLKDTNVTSVLETIIDNHKLGIKDINFDKHTSIAKSIAMKTAIKNGTKLDEREMKEIYDSLFICNVKNIAPDGSNIYTVIASEELDRLIYKIR